MKFSIEEIRDRLLPIVLSQGVGFACGVASVKIASMTPAAEIVWPE